MKNMNRLKTAIKLLNAANIGDQIGDVTICSEEVKCNIGTHSNNWADGFEIVSLTRFKINGKNKCKLNAAKSLVNSGIC